MSRKLFLCIVIMLTMVKGFCQKKYIAQYKITDNEENNNFPANIITSFLNQTACTTYLNKLTNELQSRGFIAASIDSVHYQKDTAFVAIYLGKKYQIASIDVSQNDPTVLFLSGWDANAKKGNISFEKLTLIQNKMLNYYQENGYPFAKIKLDSIAIQNNQISGKLITDKGYLHKIDSIRVFGTGKISSRFLQKFLGIPNGSLYKKSMLDNIPKKIQQLPYLQQQFPYNFTMLPSSSVVNLYLQPRKSSIVNILLGVIPAPNPNGFSQAPQSKLFLSGDANILLNNALGIGETVGLTYQQLSINSRRINVLYKHPYIFNTNYGLDAAFEMYKRDSSYLNLNANVGAIYNLGENKLGKVFFQYQKTNTFPDTALIKATKKLADNVDVKIYNLGFQYDLNTTDYRRNPRSGNELSLTTAFGTKKILVNNAISSIKDNSFNYVGLYDTLQKSTYQFKLKAYAAHYFKRKKQTVIKTAFNGGLLLSQNYFKNELYQIGGFKLLRGFDEESQFCNQYAVATIEYRYLIGGDSYFFLFTDGGYTGNRIVGNINHTYFGTGLGLNFATKAGLFNLSFAVGTRNDIPLGFKQAKLHFGYVNVF